MSLISIIMPTYNSEKTIALALGSIRRQNINRKQVEILVVDGGSSDRTAEIAKKFQAKIIKNPKVLPEHAKRIGILKAKGKYAVFMDSDEVFIRTDSLKKRLKLFQSDSMLKNIAPAGLLAPAGYPGICRYINSYGDPFSFFIHRMDGEDYAGSLKKLRHRVSSAGFVFFFKKNGVLPILDGGTHMFDLEFVRRTFKRDMRKANFATSLFVRMALKTGCLGVIKNDFISHYSTSSIRNYLKKLKWRIVLNVHYATGAGSGFGNTEELSRSLKNRKLLFILYCLSILWPLADGVIQAFSKKKMVFLLHFFFTYYVMFYIVWNYVLKFLGKKPPVKAYGQ